MRVYALNDKPAQYTGTNPFVRATFCASIGFYRSRPIALRILFLTAIAMVAFAANSLLCRMALGQGLIDPASFTTIRVISGAGVLSVLLLARKRSEPRTAPDWRAVLSLFGYMILFSFAYLSLSAGTGALILFGSVQLTMFVFALRAGEHFSPLSWAGLLIAAAGLVYLVSPGVTAPSLQGAVLMAGAGICWGFYSLLGRRVADPLQATARNFQFSVPLVVIVSLAFAHQFSVSPEGTALAVASGALASGLGYALWYAALAGLTGTRAAIVQLSVPVIAAFGGVLVLSEHVTLRLLVASAATLCGVAIVLTRKDGRAS